MPVANDCAFRRLIRICYLYSEQWGNAVSAASNIQTAVRVKVLNRNTALVRVMLNIRLVRRRLRGSLTILNFQLPEFS